MDGDDDELERLVIENEPIVRGFIKKGTSEAAVYNVSFFVRFRIRETALACSQDLKGQGYLTYVKDIVDSEDFHCVFEVSSVLDVRSISAAELFQLSLVRKYGGKSDGWEFPDSRN